MSTIPIPQGATIGDGPATNANAVPIPEGAVVGSPAEQPSATDTYFRSLYDNTLGPLVHLAGDLDDYYKRKAVAQKVLDTAGGPLKMLIDAASDESHPLHKLGAGIVNGAVEHAKAASAFGVEAEDLEKEALRELISGHAKAAGILARGGVWKGVQAVGNDLASALPGIGPAAAQAGEDIGEGKVAKGLGAATGLIGTALLPSVVKGGGAAAEAVGESAARGAGAAGDVLDKARTATGEVVRRAATESAPLETMQPEIQAGAKGVALKTAGEAGVKSLPKTATIRNTFSGVADAVFDKSKSLFRQIDGATEGAWQRNDNALRATQRAIRSATDEDLLAEALDRQQELLTEQDQIFSDAVDKGVPQETVTEARASYRQGSALNDLQSQINLSTSGRAGVSASGELISPSKLAPRLHKMFDSGRLQDALGDGNATKLIRSVESAGNQRVISVSKILKAAGIAGGGLVGLRALHSVLGGEQ